MNLPAGWVEADRLVEEGHGPGEASQYLQVDVGIVVGVVARDDAGQHARIGCLDVAGDQRDADPGNRRHAESPQHGHVAVTAAEQHQVFHDRDARKHGLSLPRSWPFP